MQQQIIGDQPRLGRAEQLAAALGVGAQSIYTYRRLGLTYPAEGESIEAWVVRARAWVEQNRRKKGPKTGATRTTRVTHLDAAELRRKRADAELKELQLEKTRIELEELQGKLHSVPECEELQVRRYRELAQAFAGMGDALARRLHLQPPDLIKVIVDEEVRRRFEIIVSRADAELAAAAGRRDQTG